MTTRLFTLIMVLAMLLGCEKEDSQQVLDFDRDGYTSDVDCDDRNASVHPGAMERCYNGIDDNCDGEIEMDEDCFVQMADGRTWTTQNLATFPPVGFEYGSSWPKVDTTSYYDRGLLYSWVTAKAVCEALGEGWRLPTYWDWRELGAAYGSWFTKEFDSPFWHWKGLVNIGAYTRLVSPLDDARAMENDFGARLNGSCGSHCQDYPYGYNSCYWSSTQYGGKLYFVGFYTASILSEGYGWLEMNAVASDRIGYFCRCVKD